MLYLTKIGSVRHEEGKEKKEELSVM